MFLSTVHESSLLTVFFVVYLFRIALGKGLRTPTQTLLNPTLSIILCSSGKNGRLFIPRVQWTLKTHKQHRTAAFRQMALVCLRPPWRSCFLCYVCRKAEAQMWHLAQFLRGKLKEDTKPSAIFRAECYSIWRACMKASSHPACRIQVSFLADISAASRIPPGPKLLPLLTQRLLREWFINLFLKDHRRVTANYYQSAAILKTYSRSEF